MDDEAGNSAEGGSHGIPKPVIPPPNLNPPPPPPRAPLDTGPVSSPPPLPSGNEGARVKMRGKGDEDEELIPGVVGFNTRVTAAVIDGVVAFGIFILLYFILPGFAEGLAWLGGAAYLLVRDSLSFLGGQSVGKKAMGIRVVTLEEKSLVGDWSTAIIRNGPLAIPLFAFVELYILLDREEKPGRGRRLGDEWAKTKVIVETKPPRPAEIE